MEDRYAADSSIVGRTIRVNGTPAIVIGGVGAVAVSRVLPAVLFGTSGLDTAMLGLVAATLVPAGICACLVPARLAMRMDPVAALRSE